MKLFCILRYLYLLFACRHLQSKRKKKKVEIKPINIIDILAERHLQTAYKPYPILKT